MPISCSRLGAIALLGAAIVAPGQGAWGQGAGAQPPPPAASAPATAAAPAPDAAPPPAQAGKSSAAPKPAQQAASAAVFPHAPAAKYASEKPGAARRHTCLDQYHANKPANANGGLSWIQKGGGYYSQCLKRLKA